VSDGKTRLVKATNVKLPRWECRSKRDAQELTDWTNAKLDEFRTIAENFIRLGDGHEPLITKERALEAGKKGDMTKFLEVYPELAGWRPPPRKVGRPPKPEDGDAVGEAATDVRLIRRVWKRSFGRFRRPQNDKVTAEKIAADRWDVDEEKLRYRLKK
jgi:hypothetical protein